MRKATVITNKKSNSEILATLEGLQMKIIGNSKGYDIYQLKTIVDNREYLLEDTIENLLKEARTQHMAGINISVI